MSIIILNFGIYFHKTIFSILSSESHFDVMIRVLLRFFDVFGKISICQLTNPTFNQ